MNGIIYKIINKINNKEYVGQTTTSLRKRYPVNWWKYTHNPYLKHSVEKYGVENFEFEIIENEIKSLEELNVLEEKYARELNTYIPNGYNIRECGNSKKFGDETREKMSIKRRKEHKLKKVNGEIIVINNLKLFCQNNKLSYSALLNLICGISDYSQGFVRPDTDPSTLIKGRPYTFMSPDGEIINGSIPEIVKMYKIKRHVLYHLVSGQCKSVNGWTIVDTT